MKRLFSKRSGFTLVEIIIAFAIFAIMATMIVQVLNLMVQRKVRNRRFEDNLAVQEEQFIARAKNMSYNKSADADGQLTFQFKDKDDSALTVDPIDFQLKNWDPDNAKNGINYFAGDYEYVLAGEGSDYFGDEDGDGDDDDGSSVGGSTQMSRFDTRLTGTKG
ncbi:MAG: prepilin-type N-terminal cleavage/methylation domain-containing protein, partial [Oscillospiraceae bacterium]|nr:prepilin-type N-terminal cleavage/methylation domain-containing protein [Oscillospiraceae bacterium]